MKNKNPYSEFGLMGWDEIPEKEHFPFNDSFEFKVILPTRCKECNHELIKDKCVNYLCKRVKSR